MNKAALLVVPFLIWGCSEYKMNTTSNPIQIQKVIEEEFELHKTNNDQSSLLILFPDLGGNAISTQESFHILPVCSGANVSVLLMNFNHHLFLSKEDKIHLTNTLDNLIKHHDLSPEKVIIGGFSSGGIVSALWSNHLIETNHGFKPQKVFVVDSPLDLVELFNNVTDVDSLSHEVSIAEAEYITTYFKDALKANDSLVHRIAEVSPFNYSAMNFENIKRLKEVDLRIYTEPDSLWWKENRGFEFEETDSYQLIRFANIVKANGWNNLQLIKTANKGFRNNGQRHPHSWSIVDPKELIKWISKE